jgi:hypothetical protein
MQHQLCASTTVVKCVSLNVSNRPREPSTFDKNEPLLKVSINETPIKTRPWMASQVCATGRSTRAFA